MSSRNVYLSSEERREAVVLRRMIQRARRCVAGRRRWTAQSLKREVLRLLAECPGARAEYVEFFRPDALRPVTTVTRGDHMALAVRVGRTRLIDNAAL
jgi:pantoate--beta-alanine ligase